MSKGKVKKKQVGQKEMVFSRKQVAAVENPEAFHSMRPAWSFSICDFDHPEWGLRHHDQQALSKLFMEIKSLEGLGTWGEILGLTNGRRGNTRNHPISVDRWCRKAQKRLEELGLHHDALHSISIAGMPRIWGHIEDGIFLILWYDLKHSICPSKKRSS